MRTSRRRFSRSTLFLALCAAAPLAGFAAGQDTPRRATSEWPQYKGNSGFTGVSSDDSIKPPLKLRWSYRLDSDASGDAGAGLTVAGGKVFANLCYARAIVALEADSGRFLWEYDDTHIGYMTVPTWHDGRVLLWERGGPRNQAAIVALDDATGKVLWRRELNGEGIDPQRAGIPVADGRAFTSAGGPAPTVSAWDAKTGAPLWQTDLDPADGEFPRAPSVAAGRVIVAQRPVHPYRDSRAAGQKQPAGAVVALDAATGKVIWRRQGAYPQKALVSDGEVIACPMWAGPDEKFHLLDANTGETKWTLNKPHYYPSTILPDKILLKPYGPQFIAVDRATGKELWHFREKGNSGCCTPVVSGNYAYMGTGIPGPPGDLESLGSFQHLHAPREKGNSGALHAVDLRTGKSVWHFGTGNTVCGEPALAYGRVHIASRDGRVYCFDQAQDGELSLPEAKHFASGDPDTLIVTITADRKIRIGGPEVDRESLKEHVSDARSKSGDELKVLVQADHVVPHELMTRSVHASAEAGALKFQFGVTSVAPERVAKLVAEPVDGARPRRDWPMQGGNAHRAGLVVDGPQPPLEAAWTLKLGGRVRTSPAVRNGRVFIGSEEGTIHAADLRTGKPLWTFDAIAAVQCSPAATADTVYCGAEDGRFHALDAATGESKWTFQCGAAVQASPAIVGGAVIFGAHDHNLYALDRRTGQKLWSYRGTGNFVQAPPVIAGDRVYFAQWHDWVRAIDLKTGAPLWQSFIPVSIESLAFHDGKLWARSPYYAIELDPKDGTRLRVANASYSYGGIAFADDLIVQSGLQGQYGTSGGTTIDLTQPGEKRFKWPTMEDVAELKPKALLGWPRLTSLAAPLVLGDRFCFATLKGDLIITERDGKTVWSHKLGESCHGIPIAADGMLLVGGDDGLLHAFRAQAGSRPARSGEE